MILKGLFTDFTWEVQLRNIVYFTRFKCLNAIFVAAMVDLIVSRFGPKWFTSNSKAAIRPILKLKLVPWTPIYVKSANSSFKQHACLDNLEWQD